MGDKKRAHCDPGLSCVRFAVTVLSFVMPTYDYQCECGKQFELFQRMSDAKLETCPAHLCDQAGKVKRLLGRGAGLIFKGGGFYETDYRSSAYQSAAKSDQQAAPSSSSTAAPNPTASTSKPSDSA